MINVLRKISKRILVLAIAVFMMSMQYELTASAAELQDGPKTEISVSDNSIPVQPTEDENKEKNENKETDDQETGEQDPIEESGEKEEDEAAVKETVVKEETVAETVAEETAPAVQETVDSTKLQTINYQDGILTDWQKITEALSTLTPEALAGTAADASVLVLQLQNVTDIPADIKNALISTDGSGRTKMLHCNVGYGASLVFNGATDNSGFNGLSNASVSVTSEKRGKRSMATTVRFASHENLGTVASLQVNLPHCNKGTKVSVYAETITVDANGNVSVGENVCIGNTKADENGNVEIAIQSTANYMFVYKGAKE